MDEFKIGKEVSMNDLPDHVSHEIYEITQKLLTAIDPILNGNSGHIILGSISLLHASLLVTILECTTEYKIELAEQMSLLLVKNVKSIIKCKNDNRTNPH